MTIFIDDISDDQENVKISFINEINSLQIPEFFSYTANSVLKSESLAEEFESISLPCKCTNLCDQYCTCSSFTSAFCNGKLSENYNNHSSRPIIECSDFCSCTEDCGNRVVQHGIQFALQVFLTEETGFGVRSKEFIPRFSFVCEYAGEIIDVKEAYERIKNYSPEQTNYIYVLKEHSSDRECTQTIIDPTYIGNVGRYLNHCCLPNLFSVPVRANGMIPKICFFAKVDILPFQELTYNYGGECAFDPSNSSSVNPHARKCLCRSLNCCGYLPFIGDNWLKT